jgi:hypothetical protein
LASAHKAVTNAEQLGDPALISRALAMSVQLNFMYGNGVDELSLRRAVELEDPDIDGHTAFGASMIEGLVLAWTGRLDDAHARMQALHRRCTERGVENGLTAVASCAALVEIWRSPFRCGPWWPLTLGEKMIRGPTPVPSWIPRAERRRRVSRSGRS